MCQLHLGNSIGVFYCGVQLLEWMELLSGQGCSKPNMREYLSLPALTGTELTSTSSKEVALPPIRRSSFRLKACKSCQLGPDGIRHPGA
ncbi:hypothetical protein J6590_013243 [Homalodisca vitripennis]|nr:hypothetical protein J6590_013243 [Homalodisca vitripennis]